MKWLWFLCYNLSSKFLLDYVNYIRVAVTANLKLCVLKYLLRIKRGL